MFKGKGFFFCSNSSYTGTWTEDGNKKQSLNVLFNKEKKNG